MREGIDAIRDYLEYERAGDFDKWGMPALFLSAAENHHGNGRLNTRVVNTIWNQVCETAKKA